MNGGKNILVTNDNRQKFVELYVNNILNKSIEKQFDAFKKGFYQVSFIEIKNCDVLYIKLNLQRSSYWELKLSTCET